MILYIPRRERSLWVGIVREGIMVEVWEDRVFAKSPERNSKFSGRIVLRGVGNGPSLRVLRKSWGSLGLLPKNGKAHYL